MTLDTGLPILRAQTEEVHYTLPQGKAKRHGLEKKGGQAVLHVVGMHRVNHTQIVMITFIFDVLCIYTPCCFVIHVIMK